MAPDYLRSKCRVWPGIIYIVVWPIRVDFRLHPIEMHAEWHLHANEAIYLLSVCIGLSVRYIALYTYIPVQLFVH